MIVDTRTHNRDLEVSDHLCSQTKLMSKNKSFFISMRIHNWDIFLILLPTVILVIFPFPSIGVRLPTFPGLTYLHHGRNLRPSVASLGAEIFFSCLVVTARSLIVVRLVSNDVTSTIFVNNQCCVRFIACDWSAVLMLRSCWTGVWNDMDKSMFYNHEILIQKKLSISPNCFIRKNHLKWFIHLSSLYNVHIKGVHEYFYTNRK